MHPPITRRSFLRTAATASLAVTGAIHPGLASAVEAFRRAGNPRLLLSLAAYSFRQYFKHGRSKNDPPPAPERQIDMLQFVDYCAEHGCVGAELTSYYFPPEIARDYLLEVRRHAFLRGVPISGTAVGNDFTRPPGPKRDDEIASVKRWIDHAAILGAPHIRVFAGSGEGMALDNAKKLCIAALEECADYAAGKGIFLGIENHGGIVSKAQDLLDIIRAVRSPWVGINLDTGNFATEHPYDDLALCAPYAVNVQFKVEMRIEGKKTPADLGRINQILRDANYQGFLALEYEAEADPWTAVPPILQRMKEGFAG